MRALLDRVFLLQVTLFHHFKYMVSLTAFQPAASAQKSKAVGIPNLVGISQYVICCFLLVAFNIYSLFLIFVSWLLCVWTCISFGLSCLGFSALPELGGDCFISHVMEVFSYYLFKYFPNSFPSLFSPSGTPIMQILMHLVLSQRSLRLSSFLFILFSLFHESDFHHSVFQFTYIYSSASVILLLQCIFHFSYCIVHLCLFFSSSRSLFHISCISICASLLFLRSWIIFTIITLNSFLGRLPGLQFIQLLLWGFILSSSFFWVVFLCCLILSNLL